MNIARKDLNFGLEESTVQVEGSFKIGTQKHSLNFKLIEQVF